MFSMVAYGILKGCWILLVVGIILEKNHCRFVSATLVAIKVSFLRIQRPFFFPQRVVSHRNLAKKVISGANFVNSLYAN